MTLNPLADEFSMVDLEDHAGNDLDVVNAARVSFAKQSLTYGDSEKAILLFLMRERHGSPFEHNYFKFKIRAPIVVIWEWVRHRIGVSYNVESGRYTNLVPEFYIPKVARTQVGKPGRYTYEDMDDETSNMVREEMEWTTQYAYAAYQKMISCGVAAEQARLVLPMCIYSTFYFTCNARSLMNFLALRNHPQAMMEIRRYSECLEFLWSQYMPDTAAAFITNGRKAP